MVEQLVTAYQVHQGTEPLASSGLAELDSLTGGMAQGRLWLVVGAPGQGRSTLVTQWAVGVARQVHQPVHLITPRETAMPMGARMLSLVGGIPLSHLTEHRLHSSDAEKMVRARELILESHLCLYAKNEEVYVPEVHPFHGETMPAAVFVDDGDLVPGLTPNAAASCAEAGMFVLISLPRHVLMETSDPEADLDPSWARVADLVLEIRHRGLENALLRPAEAELRIHYNRWGYTRTVRALHQAHYARFVGVAQNG